LCSVYTARYTLLGFHHCRLDILFLRSSRARLRLLITVHNLYNIFLGNLKKTQFNGPVLVLANIIENVMGSAAEAKVGALYIVAQEIVPMRMTLEELGQPQPATP
jgi:hypothetical protein